MYEVPSKPEIKEFVVTADMVKKHENMAELIKLPQKNNESTAVVEAKEDIA